MVLSKRLEELSIARSHKKLSVRKRMKRQALSLADRKSGSTMYEHSKQRACYSNVEIRSILLEILERSDGWRDLLHFVQNDESVPWRNMDTCNRRQSPDEPFGVEIIEQTGNLRVVVAADISQFPVLPLAKLLQKPSLSYLACTLKDKRFSTLMHLPLYKFFVYQPFHILMIHFLQRC